jgi:C4-dicarboxylate transporter DctQ subunit
MFGKIVNSLEEGIISLLMVAMTLVVFLSVVQRFLFHTGYVWTDELVLHLSAWMVLFGASYGVKVGSHIGVDVLVRLLPPAGRRIVTLVAVACCLVYCGLFIKGAWVYLVKMHRIGIDLEDIAIPKYVAHSILLIGFVLLAYRFAQIGWQVYKGDADGFRHVDEARDALEQLVEEDRAKDAEAARR